MLERHSWPGNTRELENIIHFALLVSTGDEILPEHLNLPDTGLGQLEQQLKQIIGNGSADEKAALKRLIADAGLL
ncbi:hypothetical protein D3C86_1980440 [compost metagenome]